MSTSFELILDDASPVIDYFPFSETQGLPNLLAGWNSYFSQSGFSSQLGQRGVGTSLHITSLDGAMLRIQWFGTGISLCGSVFEAAYDISIDGAAASIGLPRGELLAEVQGLQLKQHSVTLVAHPTSSSVNTSSYVAFDFAVLNVTTELTDSSVSSEFVDDTSPRWFFSGDWVQTSDPVLATQPSQTYHVSSTRGNTASISFRGSVASVTGIRNFMTGRYNVTLDGTTTTFDGRSDWFETSTLFLQAGLDEETRHSLTIANIDDASLAIVGLNITHITGGTPVVDASSSLPTGTIIVLAFSGVVAVVVVFTVIARAYYQRGRLRTRSPSFNIDVGIRSSAFFRDFGSVLSPARSRHRSGHRSGHSDNDMQELHTTRNEHPASTGNVDWDRSSTAGAGYDPSALLVAQSGHETIDPASPTRDLGVPKPSAFKVEFPDGEWPASSKEEKTKSVDRTQSLFDAPLRPETVDPTMQRPEDAHGATQRRRCYSSRETVTPLHLDISDLNVRSLTPRSATSSMMWRSSSHISSPSYRSHCTSFGTTPRMSQYSPLSVSTIRFGRPWRESGSRTGSGRTGMDHMVADEVPPPALLKDNRVSRVSSDLSEWLKVRET